MRLQTALSLLKELRSMLANPPDNCKGICNNLDTQIGAVQLAALWKTWPKYSGEMYYPIPGGEGAYSGYKWRGEQGALRLELVAYMIGELERRIRKTKKLAYYQARLSICKGLRRAIRHPTRTDFGICHTLNFDVDATRNSWRLWQDTNRGIVTAWPSYSGDPVYPVNGYSQFEVDRKDATMWDGESGRLRRSLARFIVAHYKAEQMEMELVS